MVGNHVTVHPAEFEAQYYEQAKAGLAFLANHTVTVGTATAVSVLITTPATELYTLQACCECKKAGTFTFSEAPNATATSSTALVGLNLSRASTTADTMTLVHSGTYTSSGTVLETHVIGGTSGPVAESVWWKLKPSTKYLARFTADGTTSETVINLAYYREA